VARASHRSECHFGSSSSNDNNSNNNGSSSNRVARHRHRHRHRATRHNLQPQDRRQASASVTRARRHGPHLPLALVLVVAVAEAAASIIQIPFRQRPRAGNRLPPRHLHLPHSQTPRSRRFRARWRPGHPQSSLRARASCSISLVVRRRRHLRGRPDAERRMRQLGREK
jgi:hypothetical protein